MDIHMHNLRSIVSRRYRTANALAVFSTSYKNTKRWKTQKILILKCTLMKFKKIHKYGTSQQKRTITD